VFRRIGFGFFEKKSRLPGRAKALPGEAGARLILKGAAFAAEAPRRGWCRMADQQPQMAWEKNALIKYENMIRRLPLFHRDIADEVVRKKAMQNALARRGAMIEESDILRAFFSEVPMTFYGLMIRLLEETGFDYGPYDPGHHKS